MQPNIYQVNEHDIDATLIDEDAIYVIQRLRNAGHEAYLVGGSVRDLLIKKKPKDYDISTSAKPEEIKQVFQRSCMLIGRRFRLAHIRFGRKIIEVATFRSGENDSDLIVHDNCWGTDEEDVMRRDFTINGLFYDPAANTVIDYAGGWQDIKHNLLRTIGDPVARFKQDPVRMIRLLKFQARFGFSVEPNTQRALSRYQEEIIKSSPARILEEILRMLESGAAAPFFKLMTTSGLLEPLFPGLTYFLDGPHGDEVYNFLKIADEISQQDLKHPIDRSLLTACLLYPILDREIHSRYSQDGIAPSFGQIVTLASSVIHGIIASSFSQFPKRITMDAHDIIVAQYRLTPLTEKKQHRPKIVHSREFDLAFRFLRIRALVDEKFGTPQFEFMKLSESSKTLMDEFHWWQHIYKEVNKQENRPGHAPHPQRTHEEIKVEEGIKDESI